MIICLDLGTKTGWATSSGGLVSSGMKDFSTKRAEGGGMRYLRFRRWLDLMNGGIQEVYYEEVRRHAGTQAAHVYGGFVGALTMWCEEKQIPYSCVPVGTIKKTWTGKGNASKQDMINVAIESGFDVSDDNQADALALLHCVLAQHRDGH